MKQKSIFILLITVMLIIACGKHSVESETVKYNKKKTNLERLIRKYPAFYSQLIIVSKAAFQYFKDAQKITTQDQKAEKIAMANDVFSKSKLYRKLNSLDRRSFSVLDRRIKLGSTFTRNHKAKINAAVNKSDDVLKRVSEIMETAKIDSPDTALSIIKEANHILNEAEQQLSRVEGLLKKTAKRQKKKKRQKH